MSPTTKQIHAWLQLIRPPNLITVPGDPLAGAMLAIAIGVNGHIIAAIFAAIIALLLYIAGLILNDCADIEEDLRDRPDRPLPSRSISAKLAFIVAMIISAVGIGISFIINPLTGITTTLLFITICLYNFFLKEDILIGSIIMGVCRGLSFLLGAFAVGYKINVHSNTVVFSMSAIVLYIAAITSIAANETKKTYIGIKRWFPTIAISILIIILKPFAGHFTWLSLFPCITAIIISIKIAQQLNNKPKPEIVQKSIGLYIRNLLFIQASICFIQFPFGLAIGTILLLLWPLGNKLAKKFYGS